MNFQEFNRSDVNETEASPKQACFFRGLLYNTWKHRFIKTFWLSLVTVLLFAFPAFAGDSVTLEQENGILENAQVAFLLLSGLIFAVQSFSVDRAFRFIPWMGAWLSPSIILRELDVEKLAAPQWVILIGSGTGRKLIMGIGWIILCVLAVKSYSAWKGHVGRIIRSRTSILVCAAGITRFLGAAFDHGSISAGNGKLWEEIVETIGYLLLLPAALLSRATFQDVAVSEIR